MRIRNVNAAAVARIDQLAKSSNKSRNSYLKQYIETLSVLDELKEQEEKYDTLLSTVTTALLDHSKRLDELTNLLIEIKEKNNE